MRTEVPTAPAAEAVRPEDAPQAVPWRAHLLAAVPYTLGTSGIVGILPSSLSSLGLLLGALLLGLAVLIAWRAQVRHRGRGSTVAVVGGPRSLLSAWLGGGPLLFHMALPEEMTVTGAVLLSLLLGTVFYSVLRLEDAEHAARHSHRPAAAAPVPGARRH